MFAKVGVKFSFSFIFVMHFVVYNCKPHCSITLQLSISMQHNEKEKKQTSRHMTRPQNRMKFFSGKIMQKRQNKKRMNAAKTKILNHSQQTYKNML